MRQTAATTASRPRVPMLYYHSMSEAEIQDLLLKYCKRVDPRFREWEEANICNLLKDLGYKEQIFVHIDGPTVMVTVWAPMKPLGNRSLIVAREGPDRKPEKIPPGASTRNRDRDSVTRDMWHWFTGH